MTAAATNNQAPDTREKILDAAEYLFTKHGFAATSMRAIAAEAEVNLAATNYHFGSKKGLLAAVFHRRVLPINEQRLLLLKELEDSKRTLTLRSILEALFTPLAAAVNEHQLVPALMGQIYAEPESLTKPMLEQEFSQVALRFQAAISEVLPGISAEEIQWRFHFMIGSMIHLLQFQAPLGTESTPSTFISGIERMIDYAEAGLAQVDERHLHD